MQQEQQNQQQRQSVANKLSGAKKRDTPSRNIIKSPGCWGEIIYVWLTARGSQTERLLGPKIQLPSLRRLGSVHNRNKWHFY